jgi:hypothetical protein
VGIEVRELCDSQATGIVGKLKSKGVQVNRGKKGNAYKILFGEISWPLQKECHRYLVLRNGLFWFGVAVSYGRDEPSGFIPQYQKDMSLIVSHVNGMFACFTRPKLQS